MASTVRFRIKGRFASSLTRGAIPYVGAKRLGGAARASTTKRARRVARKRSRQVLKRVARRVPETAPTPQSFPDDFTSPFREFLKSASFVSNRKRADFVVLFRVTFKKYKGSPTRILPVKLGNMTGAQARRLTEADLLEAARLGEKSGRWFSLIDEIVGVYAMRSPAERVKRKDVLVVGKSTTPRKSRKKKRRKGK